MSELKPCPFCGADNPHVMPPTCKRHDPYNPADRLYPTVRCRLCFVDVAGSDDDESCVSAVNAWNRRTPQPVTPAGGEVFTRADLNAEYARGRADGWEAHPPVADSALVRIEGLARRWVESAQKDKHEQRAAAKQKCASDLRALIAALNQRGDNA